MARTASLPNKLVLVTHGTQPTQLQIIKQLLEGGSHVRTTVTPDEPAEWLDKIFVRFIHLNAFERVQVISPYPDHPFLYADAVKDVHAIVHATPHLPDAALRNLIVADAWALTARSVLCMLEAASHEPSVEALVYTSSLAAAVPFVPAPGDMVNVGVDARNEGVVERALAGEGDVDAVRASCFVKAEEVLWGWVGEFKPGFRVNVVSASNVIGHNFAPLYTADWVNWLWIMYRNGGRAPLEIQGGGVTQAHWYVDVEDVALLHIASIFDDRICGERIQAWGCYQDRNDVIDIMRDHMILEVRRLLGEKFNLQNAWEEAAQRFPIIADDGPPCGQIYPSSARALSIFADQRFKWKGYGRWKEFEQTIRQSLAFFDSN